MIERSNGELLFRGNKPSQLLKTFGSPLYLYDEATIRERCRQIKLLSKAANLNIYYSTKANSSITLLKIIRSEKLNADAMSLGELYLLQQAGFDPSEIIYMSNNVRLEDLKQVLHLGLKLCVDSLDELNNIFKLGAKNKIFIRINNGIKAGHNKKVQTGGAVKFGIQVSQIDQAFALAAENKCKINGFCSHIGSFFLTPEAFHENVLAMLKIAEKYPSIDYIDFGGGFGVPYDKKTQKPFPMAEYAETLGQTLNSWRLQHNEKMQFGIQPGRFIVAESGACLARVQSIKYDQFGKNFLGCDLGFNIFPRPMLYGGYHEVQSEIVSSGESVKFDIAGNLCESGDVLANDVLLPKTIKTGDALIFMDAGAYSYSMSSNYTAMTKPAEVLIKENGAAFLIRKPEAIENLARGQIYF